MPWDEYSGAVVNSWTSAEAPEREFDSAFWLWHFEQSGYFHDGTPTARRTEALRLYRGAAFGRERQMSWTDDIDTARWFAARVEKDGGHGRVIQAHVQPWRLLAFIHTRERGESEWVVDPRRLRYKVIEEGETLIDFVEIAPRRQEAKEHFKLEVETKQSNSPTPLQLQEL